MGAGRLRFFGCWLDCLPRERTGAKVIRTLLAERCVRTALRPALLPVPGRATKTPRGQRGRTQNRRMVGAKRGIGAGLLEALMPVGGQPCRGGWCGGRLCGWGI